MIPNRASATICEWGHRDLTGMVRLTGDVGNHCKGDQPYLFPGASVNKCEKWSFCPLGDLANSVGCRKPHCPKATMAHAIKPFTREIVIPVKKSKK